MARRVWNHIICLLLPMAILLLSGCYQRHSSHADHHDALVQYSEKQLDSISFSSTHHYTNKYNFVVKADSMHLLRQLPEELVNDMMVDSFTVKRHALLVVADIRMVPQDSIDSVWVQLATVDSQFGWIHESDLINHVVPDDPISQFISTFSDSHLLIFLIVLLLIGMAYYLRKTFSKGGLIVHFRDFDSPYPTALVLTVSASAAFYATIQTFWPDMWRHFYYHPTLNPFAVPHILGFFLASVWLLLILGIACLDEVYHKLPVADGALYLGGLLGACAIDYLIFSISTLYFIGYPLLVYYFYWAIKRYRHSRPMA